MASVLIDPRGKFGWFRSRRSLEWPPHRAWWLAPRRYAPALVHQEPHTAPRVRWAPESFEPVNLAVPRGVRRNRHLGSQPGVAGPPDFDHIACPSRILHLGRILRPRRHRRHGLNHSSRPTSNQGRVHSGLDSNHRTPSQPFDSEAIRTFPGADTFDGHIHIHRSVGLGVDMGSCSWTKDSLPHRSSCLAHMGRSLFR